MEQLGRYRVRAEVGAGTYATVYEAQEGGQRYALKVLHNDVLPQEAGPRAGFVQAAGRVTQLRHPSVVRVAEVGDEEGSVFVAMELMDCPTLAAVLEEKGGLEEQKVILYVRQAAQALDIARDAGLFHGDLKPANVFVVSDERIRLTDFALRRLIEEPPEAPVPDEGQPQQGAGEDEDDWLASEQLLAGVVPDGRDRLNEDLVGLAGLMMSMLGVDVPPREAGESLEDYREGTLQAAYGDISDPDSGVSGQAAEVVRRLLTPGGFDSPGEVVVELASAMMLRRSAGRVERSRTPTSPTVSGATTAQAPLDAAEEEAAAGSADDPLAFHGDPRQGAFTPFFLWADRHGGRFFVLYDGEELALGRDPDVADIVLLDAAISRRHCILSKNGGVVTLEDLGSTNGTFVNDRRVREAVELTPSDNVRVGASRLYMTLPSRRDET